MNTLGINKNISLIIGIKNRVNHFIQTFPSMITQYGSDYSIVFSDFGSQDNFLSRLKDEVASREEMFSPYLKEIRCISLTQDLKFNPRKAKNMGAAYCRDDSSIFAFSDVDTFLSMDYLSYWADKIEEGKSFFVTRQQDSKASLPCRLSPEINYGNVMVYKKDIIEINGWDESINYYGGDDDDFFHRLKLKGLREINPISSVDAKQYSILHGDELRTHFMSQTERPNKEKEFERIYGNNVYNKSICDYLDLSNVAEMVELHCIYKQNKGDENE